MKKLLTILSIFLPLVISAQSNIYQANIDHSNIQVRLPKAYLLDSITIQIPDTGKVFVRFDGACTTTPGDEIIIAASDYRNWQTNDGNVALVSYDTLNPVRPFNHSRVFTVDGGTTRTFYAMVHNWTDQDGDGIVSVDGQLTVIYVPNDAADYTLAGKGFHVSTDEWSNTPKVIDTIQITVPEAGTLLINCDGRLYTRYNDTAYMAINLSPVWPNTGQVEDFFMPADQDRINFSHRKEMHVEAGTHTLYAMVRKTDNADFPSWNGFYTTLSALFIPDGSKTDIAEVVPGTSLLAPGNIDVEEVTLEASAAGKAYVSFTGRVETDDDDAIMFVLERNDGEVVVIDELLVRPELESVNSVGISLSAVVDIVPGEHTFRLVARFPADGDGNDEAEIRGFLTAIYFSPEEITATRPVLAEQTLDLYPNPTTSSLTAVGTSDLSSGAFDIKIMNAAGQLVQHATKNLGHESIDLSAMPTGMYYIALQKDNLIEVHSVQKISTIR